VKEKMKLQIEEKKVLYVFGCSDLTNTVTRLKHLTDITVDPEAKHMFLSLARKVDRESNEDTYYNFYYCLRLEMDRYFRAARTMQKIEQSTKEKKDDEID
jgi:DNA-binding SARP family transcriptional activator